MKKYLKEKINNYFHNSELDYGVTGSFINCQVENEDLLIFFKEEDTVYKNKIIYYKDFSLDQLFYIWMETEWEVA